MLKLIPVTTVAWVTILAFVLGTVTGYGYHWYRTQIAAASQTATTEAVATTATAAVEAVDTNQVIRLTQSLADAKYRASVLQQKLKDASNAKPADPSCRLPDSLRDQINLDLATPAP